MNELILNTVAARRTTGRIFGDITRAVPGGKENLYWLGAAQSLIMIILLVSSGVCYFRTLADAI